MAVDIADTLIGGDFVVVKTDKYRAYNLLRDTTVVVIQNTEDGKIEFDAENTIIHKNNGKYIKMENGKDKEITVNLSDKAHRNIAEEDDLLIIETSKFYENKNIGLNVGEMLKKGFSSTQIEGGIVDYLTDFGVILENISIKTNKRLGNMNIHLSFKEE